MRLALGPPGRNGPSGATISDAGVLIPVDAFLAKPFTVERPLGGAAFRRRRLCAWPLAGSSPSGDGRVRRLVPGTS